MDKISRKIKFRIWKDGRMSYSDEFVYFYEFFEILTDLENDCQQFTGLLDKDGKEIYEGDVVKIIDAKGWSDNARGAVGFYNGTYIIPDLDIALGDFKTEIIGNIFENPELLN